MELPKYLEVEQMLLLLEVSKRSEQNHLIIRVMLDGGLRAEEVANLKVEDLQLHKDPPEVLVHGKGRGGRKKQRKVHLSDTTKERLGGFLLKENRKLKDHVFISQRGPYTTTGIWYLVKKYGEKIGRPELHPHTLRHTCAVRLLDKGFDLVYIKDYLGHSKFDTTYSIYAQYPSKSKREQFKQKGAPTDVDV